ncbi:hypothetical protein BDA96_06G114400 [Sorghum bicolor]|uniref:Uncharacterized protein n=2 Tax=Sorghum bicolor TaxID=4558 RepID=A0A921QQQ8_SORBI|nr:hypothetical protein BDA96_06G114400 [Sorghum bicolor]KXG26447.1 hypothetical protein SORBI_3006G103500 [Sorghum bicolor]
MVPSDWANFFGSLLMSPEHFEKAKCLIQSKALTSCISDCVGINFFLPSKCPAKNAISCPNMLINKGLSSAVDNSGTSSAEPGISSVSKKIKSKKVLVEMEVRRSPRIKTLNKGFKKSTCPDKFCVGCSSKPPHLTSKAIRELSSSMCDIDAALVTDAALNKKLKTGIPGNSKTEVKKTNNKKKKLPAPLESDHPEEDDKSTHEDED